jgi:hypothetical protein
MKKKNKYDKGLGELLDLLKKNPRLMKELVFEPNNCERLLAKLKNKAARKLVKGPSEPVEEFLAYVAQDQDGYPIAQCFNETRALCAKGTRRGLCGGGTETTVPE